MTCYFSTNGSTGSPRSAASDLATVSCDPESVKSISEYLNVLPNDINLFDCSAVEIIFLRGNGEEIKDLEDPEEKLICKPHFDFLLMKWPNSEQVKRSTKSGKMIIKCSLPHESPRAVTNKASIRKDEVIQWLAETGELIHVGAPICTTHRSSLQKTELKVTVHSKANNEPPLRNNLTADMDFNLDSMDVRDDSDEGDEWTSDTNITVDSSKEIQDKISSHFSSIAKLLNSNHYATITDWKELSRDSKKRKVSLVLTMVHMLCSFVAPGSAKELENAVSEKLSPKNSTGSDKCASQVLSAIGERILAAPNRRTRVETLSMIVDLPYFSASKILLTIPTVTRYLIHKARMFNRGGVNFDEKYTKVRKNDEALDFFVSFVVRANVVLSLSWINNFAKRTDGTKVEMGASVRLHSYVAIDRMYRAELHKYDKDKSLHLSYGTIYKMLSSIFPRMNRRMVCVDEFFVDAGEGWDRLELYVKDLGRMGYLSSTEQSDLHRRIKLSRSFLEGSYRSHVETSSPVIEHCARFALSDSAPKKAVYWMKCDHSHDTHCEECREVDRILDLVIDKLIAAKEKSVGGLNNNTYELKRMIGMGERSVRFIRAYQAHVVRAVVSDSEKAKVQDALQDNEALITADWAQKVLPQSAIEPQSGYFAKGGMSVHITHIYAKLNGEYFHHSMQHLFESTKQQSADVSCIFRVVHQKLKRRGITKVTLRSDNAGSFKSSELLGDLFQIANETPVIDRYIYSESQAGKGPCDRAASHMKRKINECTKSRKKNAREAKEIFQALTTNEVVRGTSTYRCVMGAETKKKKSVIPDISMIYDVEFQADGIVSKKHSGIGKGQSTPRSKLAPLGSTFAIRNDDLTDDDFEREVDEEFIVREGIDEECNEIFL